jgi:hypothetical protein
MVDEDQGWGLKTKQGGLIGFTIGKKLGDH